MANNMTEVPANNCQNSAGDFKDPLGATGEDLEDVGGNFAYEVLIINSVFSCHPHSTDTVTLPVTDW